MTLHVPSSIPFTIIDMLIMTLDIVLCTIAMLIWLTIITIRYCRKLNNYEPDTAQVDGEVREHCLNFTRRRHFIVRALVPLLKKGPNDQPGKWQTILFNKYIVPEFYLDHAALAVLFHSVGAHNRCLYEQLPLH